MAKMTPEQAERFLAAGSHKGTLILSVPREGRGPLSVPLAFRYVNGGFEFSTKPTRQHARAFMKAGRATVMVHHESYGAGGNLERNTSLRRAPSASRTRQPRRGSTPSSRPASSRNPSSPSSTRSGVPPP